MVGIVVFVAALVALDSEVVGQVEVSEGAERASSVGSFKKREAVPTEIDAHTPMACHPA